MRYLASTLFPVLLTVAALAVVVSAAAAPDASYYERAVVRVVVMSGSATGPVLSGGTGFFVNDRHIVTNQHVTAGTGSAISRTVYFVLLSGSEEPLPVDVAWSDEQLDLSVLEYAGDVRHETLLLAAGELRGGSEVFAVGYPGSADVLASGPAHSTLTDGIVSRPPFEARWGSRGTGLATVLQHTADINPGNSGGPLLDACGGVVGVNTGGGVAAVRDTDGNVIGATAAQGIFFALHVSELRDTLDRLGVGYSATATCSGNRQLLPFSSSAAAPGPLTAALLAGILLALTALLFKRPRQAVAAGAGRSVTVLAEAAAAVSGRRATAAGTVRFAGDEGTSDLTLDAGTLRRAKHGLSIGRHQGLVDYPLRVDGLSRRHFRIAFDRGRVFVEDLHSTNGTFVNGARLKPYHGCLLQAGDTISAGSGRWRFGG